MKVLSLNGIGLESDNVWNENIESEFEMYMLENHKLHNVLFVICTGVFFLPVTVGAHDCVKCELYYLIPSAMPEAWYSCYVELFTVQADSLCQWSLT